MPFVAAPNIMMVEFRYTIDGQQCENRVMVNNQGPIDPSDLQLIAQESWNWWELTYAAHVGTNVLLREVVVTDQTTIDGAQYTYAPDATTTGAKADPLPNECAFCVSFRTGNRGRSARGRWFAVSLSTADRVDSNRLTSAYVQDFVTALNGLIAVYAGEGKPLTIVSYRSEGVPRPGGPVYFPVTTAIAVDSLIDSQRRRKPGVGA
jgi:hypothetical protein